GNVLGGIDAEITDSIIHLGGPGGAIQADDIDVERLEGRKRRANFGAQQHRARSLKRDLNRDRQALACLAHRVKHADQSGFGLEQVLARFHQQHVYSTLDESAGLLFITGGHVVESNMTERGQLGSGTDRAGDKARLPIAGELLRNLFGDLRGRYVNLANLVLQIIFGEHHAGSPEGVGLQDVTADVEKAGVDVFDNVGTAEHEDLVAAFVAPEIVHTGIAPLDIGAHGAVVDHDAVTHALEKISHQLLASTY